MLEQDFQYYLDHQEELVSKYNGRILVMKDKRVMGDFADFFEAYEWAANRYDPGSFIVQRCSAGMKDYTVRMHTQGIRFA